MDVTAAVRHIGVIGPGIVGMPMAAMLAHAGLQRRPELRWRVTVIQRRSATSGWKVEAINAGRSPIGGVEPALDQMVAAAVAGGTLAASHDSDAVADADVVLVCVQTDGSARGPDYGPLLEATDALAAALRRRRVGHPPIVVFESTLAPSSMATVVRDRFAAHALLEGRDLLLANSPNRVMPGRLVERVAAADKLVGALRPETARAVVALYRHIVTRGTLHPTNSLTAEVVKTLENAYRDVRIAFAAEIARYCDGQGLDFYAVRDAVNARLSATDAASDDATAVPSGALLIPTVGVGGHCLPKDGFLLLWRLLEAGATDAAHSSIIQARRINDESPGYLVGRLERRFGPLAGRHVALLGAAYRGDSEDTRNSPTLALARLMLERGASVTMHDPYVRPRDPNLVRHGLADHLVADLDRALAGAHAVVLCAPHRVYLEHRATICGGAGRGVFDGCNLYPDAVARNTGYDGIGRGRTAPPAAFVDFVERSYLAMERGVANELTRVIRFLNERYAADAYNRLDLAAVQRLAGTCVTGCRIADPGPVSPPPAWDGFLPRLVSAGAAG